MKNKKVKYIDAEERKDMQIWDKFLNENSSKVKPDLSKVSKYEKIFQDSFKKTERVSLRISKKDLMELKSRALEAGVNYQTFIAMAIKKMIKDKA